MIPALPHRALYAAFDRFPSRKGSAVHIDRFARALFDHAGGGLLYVLGGDDLPAYQREGSLEIVRYMREAEHVLERAAGYGERLATLLDRLPDLELVHFRDPWGGAPIVDRPGRRYTTVYEVNGLPSIELPFLYPSIPPSILERVAELERHCLEQADIVDHAVGGDRRAARRRRARDPQRCRSSPACAAAGRAGPLPPVLRRAAALAGRRHRPASAGAADDDLDLVICASVHQRRAKAYRKFAEKLGVGDRVHWHFALPERELAGFREHALLSLAPLKDCSRNVVQGCAPLKILESMASGTPVIASDLPAVREIMRDREHGRLIAPDRPSELARAVRVALDYPDDLRRMGEAARAHVAEHLSWDRSVRQLQTLYASQADWIAA